MNCTIYLPKTKLTMVEWFIKHKVSTKLYTLEVAIAKALDSQVCM